MINIYKFLENNTVIKKLELYRILFGNKADYKINNENCCYITSDHQITIGLSMLLRLILNTSVVSGNITPKVSEYCLTNDLILLYSETSKSIKNDKLNIRKFLPPLVEAAFLHELSHKKYTNWESTDTFSKGMSRLILCECLKAKKIPDNKIRLLSIYIQSYFNVMDNAIDDGRIEFLEGQENEMYKRLFSLMRNFWKKRNIPVLKDTNNAIEKLNNITDLFCYIATIGKIPSCVKNHLFYKNVAERYFNIIRTCISKESHDAYLILFVKQIRKDINFWAELFLEIIPLLPDMEDEQNIKKQAEETFKVPYEIQGHEKGKERNKKESQELDSLFPTDEETEEEIAKNTSICDSNTSSNDVTGTDNISNKEADNDQIEQKNNNIDESAYDDSDADCGDSDFDDIVNQYIPESFDENNSINGKLIIESQKNKIIEFHVSQNLDGFSDYLGKKVSALEVFIKNETKPFDKEFDYIKPINKRRKRKNNKKTGILDVSKFVNIITESDDNVFYRNQGRELNSCVEILIDKSGSMSRQYGKSTFIHQALAACETAEKLTRYIPTQITYFHDNEFGVTLQIIKEFEEFNNNSFIEGCKLGADGFNSDGVAIRMCVRHLLKRSEKNKILIVISDGLPDGYAYPTNKIGIEDTKNAVKYANENKITIIPIAIMDIDRMDNYELNTITQQYKYMYNNIISCNPNALANILSQILKPYC